MGAKARPPGPVYEPEAVAEAIVFAAEHPRRDIFVGFSAKSSELAPTPQPRAGRPDAHARRRRRIEKQKADEPTTAATPSSTLDRPGRRARRAPRARTSSWYTKVFEHHPALKVAAWARWGNRAGRGAGPQIRQVNGGSVAAGQGTRIDPLGRRVAHELHGVSL